MSVYVACVGLCESLMSQTKNANKYENYSENENRKRAEYFGKWKLKNKRKSYISPKQTYHWHKSQKNVISGPNIHTFRE